MKRVFTFVEHIEEDNVCLVEVEWVCGWWDRLLFRKDRKEEYLVGRRDTVNIETGETPNIYESRLDGDLLRFAWAQLVLRERDNPMSELYKACERTYNAST